MSRLRLDATCWVLQDASGSEGGGGGAIYLNPDGSDPHWSFDSFTPEETAAHSTYQEGMNANRNLRRALEQGSLDVIEVLDNAAWVFVSRSGAARVDVLHPLLTDERPHLGALFHEAEARLRGASTPRASGR